MDIITQIEQLDGQIKKLDKILANGEYRAAGLEISINVGVLGSDESPDLTIELGLTTDLEAILKQLRQGLTDSRAYRLGNARAQSARLQAFLANEAPAPVAAAKKP